LGLHWKGGGLNETAGNLKSLGEKRGKEIITYHDQTKAQRRTKTVEAEGCMGRKGVGGKKNDHGLFEQTTQPGPGQKSGNGRKQDAKKCDFSPEKGPGRSAITGKGKEGKERGQERRPAFMSGNGLGRGAKEARKGAIGELKDSPHMKNRYGAGGGAWKRAPASLRGWTKEEDHRLDKRRRYKPICWSQWGRGKRKVRAPGASQRTGGWTRQTKNFTFLQKGVGGRDGQIGHQP